MAPQDPYAAGMEGSNPDRVGKIHHVRHTILHFLCGFVGEGDGHDVVRRDALFFNQISNPVREYAGFPRAGARKNEKRPFSMKDRLSLLIV